MSRVSHTKNKTKQEKKEKQTKHVKTKQTKTRTVAKKSPRVPAKPKDGPEEATKKKRRHRPGVAAMIHIRKLQKSTELLLRKLPFRRMVKYATLGSSLSDDNWTPSETRYAGSSMTVIQDIVEDILIKVNSAAGRDAKVHGFVRPRAKHIFYVAGMLYPKLFGGIESQFEKENNKDDE